MVTVTKQNNKNEKRGWRGECDEAKKEMKTASEKKKIMLEELEGSTRQTKSPEGPSNIKLET